MNSRPLFKRHRGRKKKQWALAQTYRKAAILGKFPLFTAQHNTIVTGANLLNYKAVKRERFKNQNVFGTQGPEVRILSLRPKFTNKNSHLGFRKDQKKQGPFEHLYRVKGSATSSRPRMSS